MVSYVTSKLFAVAYDRKGISALECGILAAGLLDVIATALNALGGDITALFSKVQSELGNAGG